MSDIKYIFDFPHIPYKYHPRDPLPQAESFYQLMDLRRSVRDFSEKEVPLEVIEKIVLTASTAPSGAHKQPWTFCVVRNPEIKKQIRIAAEAEEKEFYDRKISEQWRDDLLPLATTWEKPFLEIAPYLIVVFKKSHEDLNNTKATNYYINESVGIACGMLITAIHNAGLVTLTHTPQPMKFLAKILDRPSNEKPFLLLPVGFPAEDAHVPLLERKELDEVMKLY